MLAVNGLPRKESGEASFRTQVQMRAWRKKNSSQLSEFQSLYGSLNGSLTDEQLNGIQQSHITNSASNPNNSSRSINRNSSREDSFYSINSQNDEVLVKSVSDRDQIDYRDEEFKSIRDNNSILSLNQTNPQIHGNSSAFPYLKNTIDEERDSGSSFTNQIFHTPKNRLSDVTAEDNFRQSQEIEKQQQHVYKLSNASQRNSDVNGNQQYYIQQMHYAGRYSQQPTQLRSGNIQTSINNRKSDSSSGYSGQDEYSQRSSIVNQHHPYLAGQRLSKEDARTSLGQPLIEGGQKKLKTSVQFNNTNSIDQKQQQQYQAPQYFSNQYTNNSSTKGFQQDPQSLIHKKQSKVNRGKSLSTLKRMMDQTQQQQQQQQQLQQQQQQTDDSSQTNQPSSQYFSVQSLNSSSQGQQNHSSFLMSQPAQSKQQNQGAITTSMNTNRLSQNYRSNNSNYQSPQNQFNSSQQNLQYQTSQIKKFSYTVLPQPSQNPDDLILARKLSSQKQQRKKTQQKSPKLQSSQDPQQGEQNSYKKESSSFYRNISNEQQQMSASKSLSAHQDKYMQEFLYYEQLRKKKVIKMAHNNRLIERKKNEVNTKPSQEQKQSRITLNLTLLISIILEKHPNLKYFLFLNHVIGAISRGFVYAFLILISIRQKFYFSIFGPAILLTRLYYIVSMYYVLFYPEQKSVSFRKISKIFNNCFHLPTEYKKPVMSEMIDVMNQNLRDQEEKSMKRKFIFCPAEINYLVIPNQDTRKKWNLFYISNFIYQSIESICLFPLVIAFSIQYYTTDQILLGFDFLKFSRYIIVGALSIFFIFCFFILIYGNKKLKFQ